MKPRALVFDQWVNRRVSIRGDAWESLRDTNVFVSIGIRFWKLSCIHIGIWLSFIKLLVKIWQKYLCLCWDALFTKTFDRDWYNLQRISKIGVRIKAMMNKSRSFFSIEIEVFSRLDFKKRQVFISLHSRIFVLQCIFKQMLLP